ncbi:hypothetical protein WSM22_09180 [Cytophagales bacterium WSM2-2]|nr:hypothetical protein WSM22_09180 [Cytophagales bacterium WSM2-2]
MFASKMGIIEWSFFSVSPFFLLTISAVLGVWGFRNREAIHENILNEEPLRIYFFVSVALIAMGALTYFASSSSDMMMDALEDLIVAAHFGGGLIFVLYVVANFAPMLVQNLPVHKVLYKPETMPYFTFRLMAVIATFAAISWATSWKTYLNQMAGTFYLVKGDISLAGKDDALAESYYQRSLLFRNQNQHAHYGLATIHARRSDSSKERQEYEKAIEWTPSPALYLNLAGIFSRQGDLLEAALTLDEGKKKFPSSGELQNAAGLSFLRLKQKDSAFYFLMRAAESGGASKAALTNMAAASAQFNAVDTSFSTFSWESGQTVNELAQANLSGQKIMAIDLYPNDTSLNVYTSMNLCNYLLNQRANADTILARKALALSRKEVNEPFSEQLMIASAHAMYARGLVSEALKTVREIAFSGNSDYFSLIGLWLLEQDNAAVASSYLKAVAEKSQPRALYYQAIAETEADSLAKATISWDSLAKSRDKNIAAFAGKMKKVLSAKPGQTNALSNDEKYLYCRYKIQLNDRTSFLKVADEIGDEHLRVQAIIDRCKKWMTIDEVNEAKNLLSLVDKVYTKNLNDQIVNLKMRLAVEDENWQFIQRTLTSAELPFNLRIYYEAILAVQSGDQAAAQQKFGYLAQANYQFEDGLIAAIRYFSAGSFDQLKNFSTLVEGLSAKPNSVKYLKQHVLMATTLGFENEAQNSLNRLRKLMPEASFKKFVTANSDFIGVRQ